MQTTEQIADFIQSTSYEDLSDEVKVEAKKRILDSIGIALGSIGDEPVEIIRKTVKELEPVGRPNTIWGTDDSVSPPQATMLNTALIRNLDFMDSILLPGETPHPSDNIGAAIVCGEYTDKAGTDLINGIAIAYEIQGEIADKAPGRDIGWDHIHVIFSSTATACKLLDLDFEQTVNAIGIATAGYNPLRVTRTGEISMWKGCASANLARNGVYTAMLAKNGMKGPVDAIDGQKGWKQIIQERDFDLDFTPGQRLLQVMTKKYMAGTHAQSSIEGVEELIEQNDLDPENIACIEINIYGSAKHVMGGGEGDRRTPQNREQADHSIPYTVAVNALDGQLYKEQFTLERIKSDDVRQLMQSIEVTENPELTDRYNEYGEQPADITIITEEGTEYYKEKRAFEGHPHNPMSWEQLEEKFHLTASGVYDEQKRREIIDVVKTLEDHNVDDLVSLLT